MDPVLGIHPTLDSLSSHLNRNTTDLTVTYPECQLVPFVLTWNERQCNAGGRSSADQPSIERRMPFPFSPRRYNTAASVDMSTSPVAISAPGKVLLAGGYLVLDRGYTGLVFGLDARIHVHVQILPTSPGLTLSEIIVKSPQFRDAEWRYGYRETEDGGGVEVTQLKG